MSPDNPKFMFMMKEINIFVAFVIAVIIAAFITSTACFIPVVFNPRAIVYRGLAYLTRTWNILPPEIIPNIIPTHTFFLYRTFPAQAKRRFSSLI